MSKNNYDEETVALEALFLEKHELALERKRLIETRTKLEKLRSEIETKAIDEMKIKEAKEIELKKQKNIDDISDKNVNVRVLYQGTQSICSKCWMGCKLSFDILLPEITLYQEEMDIEIEKLATTLSNSNPEAMEGLKKVMWQGTEHWDTLLMDRAVNSGTLVLSEFTRNAIKKFKNKYNIELIKCILRILLKK